MRPPVSHMTTLFVAASLAISCSESDLSSTPAGGTLASSASTTMASSAAGPGSQAWLSFLADPNQRGAASSLHLADMRWGRLVQVFDLNPSTLERQLVHADFLVGAGIASDGVDYELSENLAGQSVLTILHRRNSPGFRSALRVAEDAAGVVNDVLINPWSVVPRNAAISLRFDDLLDHATVDETTVRLMTGLAADTPYQARIFADANHGSVADPDGDGVYDFYSTRVIVDLTVSRLEAQTSRQLLSINNVGLPAASLIHEFNAELRIPTLPFPQSGQLMVLANPAGNALDLMGNGSIDHASQTKDVRRRFRSGGPTALTGDAFEGFLEDQVAPKLVAELSLAVTGSIQADAGVARGYKLSSVTFNNAACATVPGVGDTFEQDGLIAVVYGAGLLNGATLNDLEVRVLSGVAPATGIAELRTSFDPIFGNEQCVASYLPLPLSAPNRGVDPLAQVQVRFSEPMDVVTVDPMDSFTLASTASQPGASDLIVGSVLADLDATGFTFAPSMALPHQAGNRETYHVRVGAGGSMPTDLAGNTLAAPLAAADFQLDPNAATQLSGGLALRFDSADMLGGDSLPELRGQLLYDFAGELIKPRPVSHYSVSADRTQPVPSVMTPYQAGVQTPLSPLGSKLHGVWRYADVGFSLLDESNTNVDVEGLAWAPAGGAVLADVYDEFSIQLGHSTKLPDEYLDAQSGLPAWPQSGLDQTYANNYADAPELVHDRSRGYVVNPSDMFVASSGTMMMPYPMNRGVAAEERKYFTWRDTALLATGGANGNGAPFDQEQLVMGLSGQKDYTAGQVASIGLPLLTEFRCYPSSNALGLNAFDISLAVNSSARPNFRAFSSGGFNWAGVPIMKNPDTENVATGGFNPMNGQATPGLDNSFHIGAMDLVTRISRVHTIWFDTGAATASFSPAVVLADLPEGTSVSLDYRGASYIQGGIPGTPGYIGSDAGGIDMYGDPRSPANGLPQYLNGISSWTQDISQLSGARYLQVRITFEGDPVSGSVAELTGLGLAWTD